MPTSTFEVTFGGFLSDSSSPGFPAASLGSSWAPGNPLGPGSATAGAGHLPDHLLAAVGAGRAGSPGAPPLPVPLAPGGGGQP